MGCFVFASKGISVSGVLILPIYWRGGAGRRGELWGRALGSESICFLTVGMVDDAWGGIKQIDSDPRPSLLLGVAE